MITAIASLSKAALINHGLVSITHYEIVDGRTGRVVGTAKTRAAANRAVDRRDNAYGGYRYRAVAVYG